MNQRHTLQRLDWSEARCLLSGQPQSPKYPRREVVVVTPYYNVSPQPVFASCIYLVECDGIGRQIYVNVFDDKLLGLDHLDDCLYRLKSQHEKPNIIGGQIR